jgi:hypothetical protein
MALNPNVVIVAPGDLITAAHLNNMRANLDRLDTSKLSLTGGGLTGPLVVTATSPQLTLANASGAGVATVAFTAGGTACGTVQATTADLIVSAAGATIGLWVAGSERARLDASNLLVGKSAANAAVAGVEIGASGKIVHTLGVASVNQQSTHIGTADANAVSYCLFQRTGAATLGNITQVNTTGVAYGTTSDKRLKTLTRPVDPVEALDKVAAMAPVHFTWNDAADAGEQVGFFAQDLEPVAPEAVVVGTGQPGDVVDDQTGDGGFVPWTTDLSKLVPTLVAAIQGLTARIATLEAAAG